MRNPTPSFPRRLVAGLVPVALGGAVSTAHAAGVTLLSEAGSEVSARGLAYTAKADGIEAFGFNPAGLAQIHRHEAHFSLDLGMDRLSFDREEGIRRPGEAGWAVPPAESPHPEVHSRRVTPLPSMGYATDWDGKLPFTLGWGVNGQRAVQMRHYGAQGSSRYMGTSNNMMQGFYELGIGYALPWADRRLLAGATVGGSFCRKVLRIAVSADGTGKEDPQQDAMAEFTGIDWFAPSWSVGFLALLSDRWSFGVAYRGRSTNRLEGPGKVTPVEGSLLAGILQGGSVDVDVSIPVRMPDILRLGLRHHQADWDVEFDAVYSRWSTFGDVDVSFSNARGLESLPEVFQGPAQAVITKPLVIKKDYHDVWGFGLGGSVSVRPDWTLMAGVHHQASATDPSRLEVIFTDLDIWAVGSGARYDMGDVSFDLGGMVMFPRERTTSGSPYTSINMLSEMPGSPPVKTLVSNGRYRAFYYDLLMGVTWRFSM